MTPDSDLSGRDQRIAQADARADQADTRTRQAEVRTAEANLRAQEADTRTKLANTRTRDAEHSEESLRASELSYRRLFESARDGIMILDVVTGRISDVNPFLVELLGYSHGEMVGKTVGELSPFKDIESNQTMLVRLQKEGYVRYEDLPLETRDGRNIAVEFVSNVYLAGDLRVVQCNIRDITRRKRTEEELQLKTAFLEAQLNASLDGILVVNEQGRKILQNQRLNDLWKIPRDVSENEDDSIQIAFVTDRTKHPKEFVARILHLYAHPDEVGREEIELIDGTILDRYSAPVCGTAGKRYGRIWTFRDITAKRELELQYRQAQKMEAVGQLAGGVAHDFNNILAVIQMHADLLKGNRGLSAEESESADEIGAAVQRAVTLTRQLLLFSRREVFQPRDLNLSEAIATTIKMLKRMLGETIAMELKLAAQPLFLHADAGMLDQVLMNLCVNARDAMPGGGHLIIETEAMELDEFTALQSVQPRTGSFVRLSVSDNGGGIPPEILPRIFEPFFTTKPVGKGTGLGLATVFGIVQQHHGWVNVYSEIGHGTTFRIYLPRLIGNAVDTSTPPELALLQGGHETILLTEDDPTLRAAVRKALAQLGYRIFEASNGVKALEVWQVHHAEIGLLLTDLVMPDRLSGKDLAKCLLQTNPALKVVYMSGYSAEVIGNDSPSAEGATFLAKPFSVQKLAQAIRDRLDAPLAETGRLSAGI